MPSHCVAYGCAKTFEDGVTLFKFPRFYEEFQKWEKQVQLRRSDWVATPNSHICSDHFEKESLESQTPMKIMKLKPGAFPTRFHRPRCSLCSGAGCSICLPAIQRRIITALPGQQGNTAETNKRGSKQLDNPDKRNNKDPPTRQRMNLKKNMNDGQVVCEMCGTSGSSGDFFSKSKRFCTLSCARAFSANSKKSSILARLKGKSTSKHAAVLYKRKPVQLPPTRAKSRGFDWGSYLEKETSVAASVSCFRHVPLWSHWEDIAVGLKVEVLNTNAVLPSKVYWIATVIQVAGYKALLRYEGFEHDSSHDFWCSLVSGELNPIGWCAMTSKLLVPPQDVTQNIPDWKEYLMKKLIGANTLPVDFYMELAGDMKTSLKVGTCVEVVDPEQVNQTCVAVINSIIGGRLHLVGQDQNNVSLWCHMGSPVLHPIGWSSQKLQKVRPSPDTSVYLWRILILSCDMNCMKDNERVILSHKGGQVKAWNVVINRASRFNASTMMKSTYDGAAGLFKKQRIVYMAESFFEEGMKIETIDPLHLGHICVATVKKVLSDGYLMLSVDGPASNSSSNWFCYHASSHAVLPINFCAKNNIPLTVPPGYDAETFSWENYLLETKSKTAPARLMNADYPGHGFYPNMKLEAADLMEPGLLCVATVKRCAGRLLLIHFDGWENEFNQWVDYESPDIYPVGWCELMGFELQLPPGLVDPTQNLLPRGKKTKTFAFGRKKRKYVRKRLLADQAEENVGHRLKGKRKNGFQDLLPKMSPNIVKIEPEEQEIVPVQVKVEEIEMETPIEAPSDCQQFTVEEIKQEDDEWEGEAVQDEYAQSGSEGETLQQEETSVVTEDETLWSPMEQETSRADEALTSLDGIDSKT